MSLDTLNEFVQAIDAAGELVRVRQPVKAQLELCEIADRVMKHAGRRAGAAVRARHPARRHRARAIPVGINLFGSMSRMAMSLGVEQLDDHGDRITKLLDLKVPEGIMGKLSMLPRLMEVAKFPPRMQSGTPRCQEVVWRGDEVDLDKLPIITCWPEDGGPYITLPDGDHEGPEARHPQRRDVPRAAARARTRSRCTGSATRWARRTGARWRRRARRCRSCIAIGADPASMYSASAPLPPTVDEFIFAGFLRRKPVQLAKALTCDLEVPADADFVLEGYIDPAEALVTEGPFGDHTGFYSLADLYPLVHVTAVTMRRNPIFPATIVGRPPMEDFYLGHATERIFLPLLKLTIPEIVDYHMPAEGIFHNLVFVSIREGVSGAGVQGHERDVGAGTDVAGQGARRSWTTG